MKKINVDGIPLAKLKEKYAVIVIKSLPEFETVVANSNVFVDQQKLYFIQGSNCFVYFINGGELNEWNTKNSR